MQRKQDGIRPSEVRHGARGYFNGEAGRGLVAGISWIREGARRRAGRDPGGRQRQKGRSLAFAGEQGARVDQRWRDIRNAEAQ